jgi:PHD/YefM family antitoxin component YafN of YafNO toxin-antitoxin module
MKTITLHHSKQDLVQLIAEINEKQQPIFIQEVTGNAVLISEQEWNDIQETLYLQSIPGMVESIHQESATPIEDCINIQDIDW